MTHRLQFANPALLEDPEGRGRDRWRLPLAERAVLSGLELDELACIDWTEEEWRRLALVAVRVDGRALRAAGSALQSDREVTAAAVAEDAGALSFVGDQLFVGEESVGVYIARDKSDCHFIHKKQRLDMIGNMV
jgi:hypothetical protein